MHQEPALEIQTILDNISDGFLILDKDLNIKWYNTAFEKIAGGYDLKSNKNLRKLIQSIDGMDIGRQVRTAADKQQKDSLEVFLPSRKEWYAITIYPSAESVVVYFQDITASKHRESVFIDEQNLRILIDIIEQPVWLVDTSCSILLCNEAFKRWISYFIGKPLLKGDNVLAEDLGVSYLNKFRMCYDLALNGKVFTSVEDMMVDGELKFTTISFNPVFDSDGKISAISCHASDITDQRKHLSRIGAQTELLMEIANMQSHKVRGPVATLLGLVQNFDFEDMSNPDNAEIVEGIATVTKALDTIVKDVIRNINKLNKHTRSIKY